MAPKDDTFNHSGWWVACTERSRWRWRSLPEAQPAVGIVWIVDGGWWVVDGLRFARSR